MSMERRGGDRGRDMPRSYSYVGNDSAEDECKQIQGDTQREEQSDDI